MSKKMTNTQPFNSFHLKYTRNNHNLNIIHTNNYRSKTLNRFQSFNTESTRQHNTDRKTVHWTNARPDLPVAYDVPSKPTSNMYSDINTCAASTTSVDYTCTSKPFSKFCGKTLESWSHRHQHNTYYKYKCVLTSNYFLLQPVA